MEGFTAIASLVVAIVLGPTWDLVPALVFTWALLTLTLIDLDHQLLPDSITVPLVWLGLLVSLTLENETTTFADLHSSVLGAAAGYLSLWFVYRLFKLATGKEGMGYGDFKLLAAIGAWLGWQMLPLVILISAGVGTVIGTATLLVSGKSKGTPIAFGPYLAIAGWLAMLWGQDFVGWYESSFL